MVDFVGTPIRTDRPDVEGVRISRVLGWTIGPLEGEIERVTPGLCCPVCHLMSRRPRVRNLVVAGVLARQPLPLSLLAIHPIDNHRN